MSPSKKAKNSTKIRVRFAPSPTGFLHIGGLRTALYNYLFARKNKGIFVLRIEDTDRTRYVEGAIENIIRTLQTTGLTYDEGPHKDGEYGPYIQSERLNIYQTHAKMLVESGNAYYCICTPERLEGVRHIQEQSKLPTMYDGKCREAGEKEGVVRLKVPKDGETSFMDIIHGQVAVQNRLVDDQVLLKSDGFPTYHLANVVDDHLMEITHVIRGEEWISSVPKHVLLYQAFGWNIPAFAHLPLLLNADKSKLSKRQNDVSVENYLEKGYLPQALVNFVALLGWNPTADREIYSLEELIAHFDLGKVNKSGTVVNFEKLDWMNGEYIKKMPVVELTELCIPYLQKNGLPTKEKEELYGVITVEQERMKRLDEVGEETRWFFEEPIYDPELLVWKKSTSVETIEAIQNLLRYIAELDNLYCTTQELEKRILDWIGEKGYDRGTYLWPLRVALSGKEKSPSPFMLLSLLKKEKSLERLQKAKELLEV